MVPRPRLEILLLTGAVAATRFGFRSHYLYDLDSVNFALAIGRFDPRVHQPHPPGYFLYILLGRFLNAILHDANLALVILSIAASCGAAILIYTIAWEWFGITAARFAGMLFLLSPLAWFHGTVALTYSVEAFFSALLGYLCWRMGCGRPGLAVPAAVILGISAGVRPSSLLFLGPLFLFSLRDAPLRRKLSALGVLALTLAAWFFPMIWASGGLAAYLGALTSLWRAVPGRGTVFNSSPATSIARACTIVFIYFLAFGAASLAPLAALRNTLGADPRKRVFTLIWIAPALCFFTFIFLQFVNSGYLLLLAPAACVWLGAWAAEWYETTLWPKSFRLGLIGLCAAANTLIFVGSPFYCSYRSVHRFEAELRAVQLALPQVAPAGNTLIISFDSHFLGYRHAGYYLPGYLTVEYPEVKLKEGARIFVMQDRDTHLVAGLPADSCTGFVLFPLPEGSAYYSEYLRKVMNRLPEDGLRTTRVGGEEFISGPISDLPLLFPDAAAKHGVYALLHSPLRPVNNRAHRSEREIP